MNLLLAFLMAVAPCQPGRGGTGHHARSRAVRAAFQRSHPCPSTHRKTGACTGWVIDHKVPLVCCGTDTANNQQWQTVADAKAKDRTESICTGSAK